MNKLLDLKTPETDYDCCVYAGVFAQYIMNNEQARTWFQGQYEVLCASLDEVSQARAKKEIQKTINDLYEVL